MDGGGRAISDEKTPFAEKLVDAYKEVTTRLSPEQLDAYAGDFLMRFAESAFRGQEVSDEFVFRAQNTYYMAERKAGKNFLQAMVDPLAMILSSPRFLYPVNPSTSDKENNRVLDGLSLANRLSSFLWSGSPDQELLELARNGSLLNKSVLLEQAERLMSNARAKNFHKGFISQWMHLDRLDGIGLSSRFYLHLTDAYIHSAKQEPVEFFKTLLEENLPANNLIDSDFVTVDGVLAAKYGLHDQYSGNGFQKVSLSADSPRGGLMTQASFLAIGTMGNRMSHPSFAARS